MCPPPRRARDSACERRGASHETRHHRKRSRGRGRGGDPAEGRPCRGDHTALRRRRAAVFPHGDPLPAEGGDRRGGNPHPQGCEPLRPAAHHAGAGPSAGRRHGRSRRGRRQRSQPSLRSPAHRHGLPAEPGADSGHRSPGRPRLLDSSGRPGHHRQGPARHAHRADGSGVRGLHHHGGPALARRGPHDPRPQRLHGAPDDEPHGQRADPAVVRSQGREDPHPDPAQGHSA